MSLRREAGEAVPVHRLQGIFEFVQRRFAEKQNHPGVARRHHFEVHLFGLLKWKIHERVLPNVVPQRGVGLYFLNKPVFHFVRFLQFHQR